MEDSQTQQVNPQNNEISDAVQQKQAPKKSSNTTTIVLVIIIALLLCLSGFLAYQNYLSKGNYSKPEVTSTPQPSDVIPTPEASFNNCEESLTYEGRCEIFGDITAYRGETDYYTFKLEAFSMSGSDIEMQFGSDKGILSDGWVPFTDFIDVPHSDFDTYVFVEYRDLQGNITPVYVSTTSPLYPTGELAE